MVEMITEKQAEEMIFGFVIMNDWSARDIQQWEYVPLCPFQAKVFATSISPWVVTREALEPFRLHGPVQDPRPLPYLQQTQPNNYDMALEVDLRAAPMNAAKNISRTNFKYMYWSSVQQLVHHAACGCAMNVGDLLGSGTISGPEKDQRGSLLEMQPRADAARKAILQDCANTSAAIRCSAWRGKRSRAVPAGTRRSSKARPEAAR
jgi:fumarylacetoacetase